jgi:pimeloyl-ACP methyl ester carboxylesterase
MVSSVINQEILDQHKIDSSFGIDGIIFKPPVAKKVVVCFSGMNLGRYERWSWFYQRFLKNDQTIYIVFKDDDFLFYLNREGKDTETLHAKFLLEILKEYNLTTSKLYTVGSSMGGYAAIYYSLLLSGGGAIVSNPLVDLDSATHHSHTLWTRKIKECNQQWKNIIDMIKCHKNKTNFFLSYGNYLPDVLASSKLINALNETNLTYVRHRDEESIHRDTLNKKNMFQLINFWNSQE